MGRNLTNTLNMMHDLRTQFAPQSDSQTLDKGYGSIKRTNKVPRSRMLEDDVADLMGKIDLIF